MNSTTYIVLDLIITVHYFKNILCCFFVLPCEEKLKFWNKSFKFLRIYDKPLVFCFKWVEKQRDIDGFFRITITCDGIENVSY